MKWNKILEASPQNQKLTSNLGTLSRKSKLRETPSSHKLKAKKENDPMMENSFSAVIGKLQYEEEDGKKSMVERASQFGIYSKKIMY